MTFETIAYVSVVIAIVSSIALFKLTGLKLNWLNVFKTIAFAGLIIIAFWTDHAFGQTIHKHGYTIYYNPKIKAPDSTSFDLSPIDVSCPPIPRKDAFAADPELSNGPKPSDFANPKGQPDSLQVDKGHTYSFDSSHCNPLNKHDCWYVDGMYVQFHGYNNGDWKEFEAYERLLAGRGKIHVINGYIGIQGHLKAGEIIPTYMYKAIYHNGAWEVFCAPNRPWAHGHNINIWHVTTAWLDKQTGLKL